MVSATRLNIITPVLRLLALGLELLEETSVNLFNFDAQDGTYLCFMKYYSWMEEDEARTKNVWMKGHTDIDVLSMLWSQPVTALQVLSPDGKWRYVKHIPNSIVVNAGDTLEMCSGGYYEAALYRVFRPPADQRGRTRLGLYYFGYPDDVRLVPFAESPVLWHVGITCQRKVSLA
ncbi:hypothetical protein GSI_04597 [Ganoderma sinense ZZ0214-1]|uniref:Isopenicillin N synthase-like Fe(2+) 2OG dioxygenase domain-containing protein n=1 Tax=Ganoderma sinense ZZ0214-1 TaxID=1077348 RepID=A0A2G8SHG0_9APHY|nr:hypothetical protein GSI_04597 [Ganoderma sinense ZZ0214-1]